MAEPTMGEMARWTFYQRFIAEHIRDTDPRHVEAWMRVGAPDARRPLAQRVRPRDVRGAGPGPGRRTRRVGGPGGLVRSVDHGRRSHHDHERPPPSCAAASAAPASASRPHEAPVSEFPAQPSQKDGLGAMCTEHWRAYVKGLREARVAAKAADEGAVAGGPEADAA